MREARQARGWTQADLAREMSELGHPWRQSTVAKTEAAERPIRVNELWSLAVALGAAVGDLLGSQDDAVRRFHALLAAEGQVENAKELVWDAEDELKRARARLRSAEAKYERLMKGDDIDG